VHHRLRPRQSIYPGGGIAFEREERHPQAVDADVVERHTMACNWRVLVGLSFAVLLFGAAMIANVSQSSMPQLRGAWVAQALRTTYWPSTC
jgi:hypothetical protein